MGNNQSSNGVEPPLPPPRPPRKLKRDLVRQGDQFKEIDNHALRTPSFATVSVAKLSTHLAQGAKSDLEKIRAFYRWITENIRYDTRNDFHDRKIDTSGEAVLRMRSSVCIGYANLFAELCRECQIPVKIISGYSKSFHYNPERVFTTDQTPEHAWNAVYIHGNWQLVECTWGAGTVDDRGTFIKKFSDFHFLTEPKHFVVTHFPYMDSDMSSSQAWQLLPKSLSLETFSERLKGFSPMYEWNLKPISHPNGIISFTKKTEVSLRHPSSYFFVSARLVKRSSTRNFDQYVLIEKLGGNRVRIRVTPPEEGTFTLKLFGRNDPKIDELNPLTDYVLKCEGVDGQVFPFPTHQGPFGSYGDHVEAGFHKSVGEKSILETKNGKIAFPIKTTKTIDAIVKLDHATENLNSLDNYALLEREKGQLLLKAMFPSKGYYKLSIFTKNENKETYSPRVAYLIFCSEEYPKCEPFPKVFPQTTQFECLLLSPVTCKLKAHEQIQFRFSSPKVVQARLDGNLMEKRGNVWEGVLKTSSPGQQIKISASDKKGDSYWGIYVFNVTW